MTAPTLSAVRKQVEEEGPLLSSALADRLVAGGLAKEAARKRISRALSAKAITRVPLTLPHNDHLIHVQAQYATGLFWERLRDALWRSGSVYGLALESIARRGGAVRRPLFATFSGSPTLQSGHLPSDGVLERLLSAKVLQELPYDPQSSVVALSDNYGGIVAGVKRLKAVEMAEVILLSHIREWVRKLGLGSYDKVVIRDLVNVPKFAQCNWDLVGPSYMYPMVQKSAKGVKPGFFVADVNLLNDVDEGAAAYFAHKCRVTRAVDSYPKFMAMLIGAQFSLGALNKLRQEGIVAATVENLFGLETAQSLISLINILENAAKAVTQDPEAVFGLINKLSKIEGAAINLRGALFEMLCGYAAKKIDGFSVDIGVKITGQGGNVAEIDVLGTLGNVEIFACECKGYSASSVLPNTEIQKWLARLPTIRSYLEATYKKYSQLKKRFELWTPAKIDADGVSMLTKASGATQYQLGYKDGDSLRAHMQKLNEKSVYETLLEHFYTPPST